MIFLILFLARQEWKISIKWLWIFKICFPSNQWRFIKNEHEQYWMVCSWTSGWRSRGHRWFKSLWCIRFWLSSLFHHDKTILIFNHQWNGFRILDCQGRSGTCSSGLYSSISHCHNDTMLAIHSLKKTTYSASIPRIT